MRELRNTLVNLHKTVLNVKLPSEVDKPSLIRISSRKVFISLLIFLFVLPSVAWANPQVQQKKSELQKVKKELDEIDARLDMIVEDYNEARYKLSKTRSALRKVEASLKENEEKLGVRKRALASRVRGIYMSGDMSALELVFGTRSLDEFVRSMRYVSLLIKYDAQLLREIKELKAENEKKREELLKKKKEEEALVARLASKKKIIENELRKRNELYQKIKGEIASLEAAEARRQEELRRAYLSNRTSSAKTKSYRVSRGGPRGNVVSIALAQLGKPYRWGAAGPNAFDCSGLVVYCFAKIGISLPHSSRALYRCGTPVSRSELRPGDLVFFARRGRIHHVGIYVGNGNYIHAPHTGAVVRINSLSSHRGYAGARRI